MSVFRRKTHFIRSFSPIVPQILHRGGCDSGGSGAHAKIPKERNENVGLSISPGLVFNVLSFQDFKRVNKNSEKVQFLTLSYSQFLFLCFHIENNLKFERFSIGFLGFIVSPEFIQANSLEIPGSGIIPIEGECPGAGE